MSRPGPTPEPALPDSRGGFLAPSPTGHPISHCIRCGKETPPGVSLCDADNPGRIKAPSATQAHATILVGVVAGFLGAFLLFRFAVSAGGPFPAAIAGHVTTADGGLQIAVTVTNDGDHESIATCRVSRDGLTRPDDFTFRTDRLAAGASQTLTRTIPAPDPPAVLDPAHLSVVCT